MPDANRKAAGAGVTFSGGLLSVFCKPPRLNLAQLPDSVVRGGNEFMPVLREGQWHIGESFGEPLSSAGHGFCGRGSRVFREMWVANSACWWIVVLAWGCGNFAGMEFGFARCNGFFAPSHAVGASAAGFGHGVWPRVNAF